MALRRWLREAIFGITIPQEYVCVGLEEFQHPLSSFLTSMNAANVVPVQSDVLLGYRPMIMAFPYDRNSEEATWLKNQETVCLSVVTGGFRGDERWQGYLSDKCAVARLLLRKVHVQELADRTLVVFAGIFGEHRFLNSWYQFTNRLRERLRLNKPDNYLEGNLYDQVRIGYGEPRTVSIITVRDGGRMNMFPTDLHGPVGRNSYVGSMRHGGKANSQIEGYGSIALSNVRTEWFRAAYALGKNHMGDLRPEAEFALAEFRTETLGIPLPESVVQYRELRRSDAVDIGIHRIHFYETIHEKRVSASQDTLAHIHCYYAQWRQNRRMKSEYLLR